jgi:hypothetical protein
MRENIVLVAICFFLISCGSSREKISLDELVGTNWRWTADDIADCHNYYHFYNYGAGSLRFDCEVGESVPIRYSVVHDTLNILVFRTPHVDNPGHQAYYDTDMKFLLVNNELHLVLTRNYDKDENPMGWHKPISEIVLRNY